MVVRIDGSVGEGGGQILRTSLAMAALLGCEIEIINIRRGRKKPGLQPQHLTAVRAVRDISRGRAMGDELGSEFLIFTPGKTYGGEYQFDVAKVQASAGSVSLVFQAVLPALLFAAKPTRLVLKDNVCRAGFLARVGQDEYSRQYENDQVGVLSSRKRNRRGRDRAVSNNHAD
jgi:RNA 3'-terminal phosphate cyclase (ATP)